MQNWTYVKKVVSLALIVFYSSLLLAQFETKERLNSKEELKEYLKFYITESIYQSRFDTLALVVRGSDIERMKIGTCSLIWEEYELQNICNSLQLVTCEVKSVGKSKDASFVFTNIQEAAEPNFFFIIQRIKSKLIVWSNSSYDFTL